MALCCYLDSYVIWIQLLATIFTYVTGDMSLHRKPETLFSNLTYLLGRTVSCDNVQIGNVKYPADTWTCYNMRVDGLRLRYWYIPGFGAETECSDGQEVYDSRNDISGLCREMMKSHGYHKDLWTAFVNEASCSPSHKGRIIFTKKGSSYQWETFYSGRGHVKTLRCMAID